MRRHCLSPRIECVPAWLQVRELIYREILEYHPHMLAEYLQGGRSQPNFMYPSAVDNFKRQFAQLESSYRGMGMGNLGQVFHLPPPSSRMHPVQCCYPCCFQ